MLQSPNPVNVARNFANPSAGYSFTPSVTPMTTIYAAEAFANNQGGSLGYFGNNGNYIHLVTGFPNLLLYDDQEMHRRAALSCLPGVDILRPTRPRGSSFRRRPTPETAPTPATPTSAASYSPVNVVGFPPRTLFVRNH